MAKRTKKIVPENNTDSVIPFDPSKDNYFEQLMKVVDRNGLALLRYGFEKVALDNFINEFGYLAVALKTKEDSWAVAVATANNIFTNFDEFLKYKDNYKTIDPLFIEHLKAKFERNNTKAKENLIGGESDYVSVSDLAKKYNVTNDVIEAALDKGRLVEMEHTDNPVIAHEIAKDHIWKDGLDYYDKLEVIEKSNTEQFQWGDQAKWGNEIVKVEGYKKDSDQYHIRTSTSRRIYAPASSLEPLSINQDELVNKAFKVKEDIKVLSFSEFMEKKIELIRTRDKNIKLADKLQNIFKTGVSEGDYSLKGFVNDYIDNYLDNINMSNEKYAELKTEAESVSQDNEVQQYDYNNPITLKDIRIISVVDKKDPIVYILKFEWNGAFFQYSYRASKTSGSILIEKYKYEKDIISNMATAKKEDPQIIYNTFNSEQTTDEGNYIEYSINKISKKDILEASTSEVKKEQQEAPQQEDLAFKSEIETMYQQKAIPSTLEEVKWSLQQPDSNRSVAMLNNLYNWEGFGANYKATETKTGGLHEFFTPYWLCYSIGEIVKSLGIKTDKVLDPAAGTLRLLRYINAKQIHAFEINEFNYKICKKIYPLANIYNQAFETAFLKAPRFNSMAKESWLGNDFDLVVSNPPYGEYKGEYKSYMPKVFTRFEFLFVDLSMSLVKSGGYGIFVLPQSFMNNGNMYNKMKEKIMESCQFVDAVRLPNGIFKTTDIGVDLLILKKL